MRLSGGQNCEGGFGIEKWSDSFTPPTAELRHQFFLDWQPHCNSHRLCLLPMTARGPNIPLLSAEVTPLTGNIPHPTPRTSLFSLLALHPLGLAVKCRIIINPDDLRSVNRDFEECTLRSITI